MYAKPTYGQYLTDQIMMNNTDFIENMIARFEPNYELLRDLGNACIMCDLHELRRIGKLIDISHPVFDSMPEGLIENVYANRDVDYKTKKNFLKILLSEYMNVNVVPIELFDCVHITYIASHVFRLHSSFNSVATLLDALDICESGDYSSNNGYLNRMLRKLGAKTGPELGYTHEDGHRLINIDFAQKGYNYEWMRHQREMLHQDLIAHMFHPSRIERFLLLHPDTEVEDYLS